MRKLDGERASKQPIGTTKTVDDVTYIVVKSGDRQVWEPISQPVEQPAVKTILTPFVIVKQNDPKGNEISVTWYAKDYKPGFAVKGKAPESKKRREWTIVTTSDGNNAWIKCGSMYRGSIVNCGEIVKRQLPENYFDEQSQLPETVTEPILPAGYIPVDEMLHKQIHLTFLELLSDLAIIKHGGEPDKYRFGTKQNIMIDLLNDDERRKLYTRVDTYTQMYIRLNKQTLINLANSIRTQWKVQTDANYKAVLLRRSDSDIVFQNIYTEAYLKEKEYRVLLNQMMNREIYNQLIFKPQFDVQKISGLALDQLRRLIIAEVANFVDHGQSQFIFEFFNTEMFDQETKSFQNKSYVDFDLKKTLCVFRTDPVLYMYYYWKIFSSNKEAVAKDKTKKNSQVRSFLMYLLIVQDILKKDGRNPALINLPDGKLGFNGGTVERDGVAVEHLLKIIEGWLRFERVIL